MPSVSFSVEMSVDDRLTKFTKSYNKNKISKQQIDSRTEAIDKLLNKAGF